MNGEQSSEHHHHHHPVDPTAMTTILDLLAAIQNQSNRLGNSMEESTDSNLSDVRSVNASFDEPSPKALDSKASNVQPPIKRTSIAPEAMDRMDLLLNEYEQRGAQVWTHISSSGAPLPSVSLSHTALHDWSSIVHHHDTFNKEEKTQQLVIMELISTELAYVKCLQEFIHIYQAPLLYLKQLSALESFQDMDDSMIFGNIGEIYKANCDFLNECVFQPYSRSKLFGTPLNVSLLRNGFLKFSTYFKPYKVYCEHLLKRMDYIRELERKNPLFQRYLQWCEKQNVNIREGIKAMLAKPHQRLTKYPLLLDRIKKHTHDRMQQADLDDMYRIVVEFITEVDSHKHATEAREGLEEFVQLLEGSKSVFFPKGDNVEQLIPASWRDHSWIVHSPYYGPAVREKLYATQCKYKEANGKWLDVWCHLFSDLLLICSPSRKLNERGLKIVHAPIRLDKLYMAKQADSNIVLVADLNDFARPNSIFCITGDAINVRELTDKLMDVKNKFLKACGFVDACSGLKIPISLNHSASNSSRNGRTTSDLDLMHLVGDSSSSNGAVPPTSPIQALSVDEKLTAEQVMASPHLYARNQSLPCIRPMVSGGGGGLSPLQTSAASIPPSSPGFSAAAAAATAANYPPVVSDKRRVMIPMVGAPVMGQHPDSDRNGANFNLIRRYQPTVHSPVRYMPADDRSTGCSPP